MSSSNKPSSSLSQLQSETKFPTNGLKSLLKNSDLLEILLKPMSKTPEILNLSADSTYQSPTSPAASISLENVSPGSSSSNLADLNNNINIIQQLDLLNEYNDFSDKLEPKLASPNQQQQQQQNSSSSKMASNVEGAEYLELLTVKSTNSDGDSNPANIYGNPFLGPNLWDKNDLFQGGVQFEHLEIDDFLNENGLSETDVQFLDQIQKLDPLSDNVQQTASNIIIKSTPPLNNPNTNPIPSDITTTSRNFPTISDDNSTNKAKSVTAKKSSTKTKPAKISNGPKTRQRSQQKPKSAKQSIENQSSSTSLASSNENRSRKRQKRVETVESSRDTSLQDDDTSDSGDDDDDDDDDESEDELDFDPKKLKISEDDLRPQPVLRKSKKQFVPNEMKDDKYWHRRRKNNMAAKRSRDARRMKENQIAIRASYLERENDTLRRQLDESRRESKSLKQKIAKYEALYPDMATRQNDAADQKI